MFMRYNLSRISEFLQTHAEELENIGLGDCETKNISDKIKSIILFYQENKERVLKYDPQLEGVFNAAIDTIKKTESGKKVNYSMTEVSFIFLIANYLIFDKYDIIMYSGGKKKYITYEDKDKYVLEFKDTVIKVLKIHYFGSLDVKLEEDWDKDSTCVSHITSNLFEEFISQYLYTLVDEELELERLLLDLAAKLSTYGKNKGEIISLLEETECKIKTVKKLIKNPPRIVK